VGKYAQSTRPFDKGYASPTCLDDSVNAPVLATLCALGLVRHRHSPWLSIDRVRQKKNVTSLHHITRNLNGHPKALIMEDFKFYANNRVHLSHEQAIASTDIVESVSIQFRQQKNGQNSEWKTITQNHGTPTIDGVTASICIIKRAQKLNLNSEPPVCVFTSDGTADGARKFITEMHIAERLQHLAKLKYGITKAADLARYTSHSVRVGACVALHAAGLDKLDIQNALRWRSTTFWNYLRNLPRQAACCMEAICNFNPMSTS